MPYDTAGEKPRRTRLPARAIWMLGARNLLRQPARSGLALAAVVFGVAGLIVTGGFIEDIFAQLAEAIVHSQSGHLQIAKAGYFGAGSRTPERYLLDQLDADKARIISLPQVKDVMARLRFSGLISTGRADLAIAGEGIEPTREADLGSFMRISAGRNLATSDRYGALVGQGVAQSLGLRPGDRVNIVVSSTGGAINVLDFDVLGVFQSFSKDYDARVVKIPLPAAQELMGTVGANILVVSLHRTSDTESIAKVFRERVMWRELEVRTWEELNDFYPKTVQLYRRQFGVLQLIVLAMVLVSVANSINMTVFERMGEFGTMRALGNRNRDVMAMVIAESALLGAIGATVGVLVGCGLSVVVSRFGIPMPPPPNSDLGYEAYIRIVPESVAAAALVGVLAATLAAMLPGIRAATMPVVDALRQNV